MNKKRLYGYVARLRILRSVALVVRSFQTLIYLWFNLRGTLIKSRCLENIRELVFLNPESYKVINLSFGNLANECTIYARMTNSTVLPRCDLFGNQKTSSDNLIPESYVVKFRLKDAFHETFGEIEFVSKLSTLEDPRFFTFNENDYLLCTKLIRENDTGWPTQIAILDINESSITSLTSPLSSLKEKNWIHWPVDTDDVQFIYKSLPFSIVTVDMKSKQVLKFENVAVIGQQHKFDYHGGSNVTSSFDGKYVRLARRRLRLLKFGFVHVQYLLIYDSNLNLLFQSRPFLFTGFGFEICNSVRKLNQAHVITWTEDDKRTYIAEIDLKRLLDWVNEPNVRRFLNTPFAIFGVAKLLLANRKQDFVRTRTFISTLT